MSSPSNALTDGTCHFLRLPAELRNVVYKYALFSPGGVACNLEYKHGSFSYRLRAVGRSKNINSSTAMKMLSTDVSQNDEFLDAEPLKAATHELNQLKFVCRQLNMETKCVAMSINAIVFLWGVPNFIEFTINCPKSVLDHISCITIHHHQGYDAPNFCEPSAGTSLRDFCKQRPAIAIKLRHSWLDPQFPDFFGRIIEFAVHFRHDREIVAQVTACVYAQQYLIMRAVNVWYFDTKIPNFDDLEEYPKNLRVFPPFKSIDNTDFESHYLADAIVELDVDMSNGFPRGVELAKRVFEHGI